MNRFYKPAFFLLLIIFVIVLVFLFWSGMKSEYVPSNQPQIVTEQGEKDSLRQVLDQSLAQLDSITSANATLMEKLGKKSPNDSLIQQLTEPQKRMLRLIDSVNSIKIEINGIAAFINRNVDRSTLPDTQKIVFDNSGVILGNMLFNLDLAIDNTRLELLKNNTEALKTIISKFDKKMGQLDKLSKVLEKFTKYMQVSIDVFTSAVSNGVIVLKAQPVVTK